MKMITLIMVLMSITGYSQTIYYFSNDVAGAQTVIENSEIKFKSNVKWHKQKNVFKFTKYRLYYKSEGKPEGIYLIDKDDYLTADSNHHYIYLKHEDGNKYIIDIRLFSKTIWWISDHATMIFTINSTHTIK